MKHTYLAIDYGTKHLGLALARTPLAEPWQTIPAEKIETVLPTLIDQQGVDTVVIGLSEGNMALAARQFGHQLQTDFPDLKIVFTDETLSSKDAAGKLTTHKRQKRFGPDHHYAAAVFLQEYLDFQD